ncbi:MAG: HEAT repeat domain-containing protein [Planctomycetota bacterium]|jgi:HEAT repeat protein
MSHRRCPFLLALLLSIPTGRAALAGESAEIAAVKRLLTQAQPSARAAALRRLAGYEGPAALDLLEDGLADPHPYVRRAAAGVLGVVPSEAVRRRLARRLRRLRSDVARAEACRAFALWADDLGHDALVVAYGDGAVEVREAAIRWLAEDPGEPAGEVLRGALQDPAGGVRALAIDTLRARAETVDPLPFLADPDWRVRLSALESSAAVDAHLHLGEDAATVAVLRGLDDAVWSVRLAAAELAGRGTDRRLLPALVRVLEDERRRVADAAHHALVQLTGIPFDPEPARWRAWLETDGADFRPGARERPRPAPFDRSGRTVAGARFLDLPLVSSHVAFVLDASGSMASRLASGESRWDRVCSELEQALARLDRAHVNLIRFADTAEAAFPRARPLTRSTRAALARWLSATAPGGRTALYDGIEAALADEDTDTVVLLSDGAPSAGAFFTKTDLLQEVGRRNRWRKARIDVISIGGDGVAARWRDVLKRIARESGGTYVTR